MKKNTLWMRSTMLACLLGIGICNPANASEDLDDIKVIIDNPAAVNADANVNVNAGTGADIPLEEGTITDYKLYDDLLQEYISGINAGWSMQDFSSHNLCYLIGYGPDLNAVGYYTKDLDQNGISELLIGEISNEYQGMIYDLYTIQDGEVLLLATSGERSPYYLCADGIISNYGSGSAFTSATTFYELVDAQLTTKEMVLYDSDYDEVNPWFYNTSGDWSDHSTPITESQAREIENKYTEADVPYTALSAISQGSTAASPSVNYTGGYIDGTGDDYNYIIMTQNGNQVSYEWYTGDVYSFGESGLEISPDGSVHGANWTFRLTSDNTLEAFGQIPLTFWKVN